MLDAAVKHEKNATLLRRLQAIRLLLGQTTVPEAARQIGVPERSLRRWVHRFNRQGPEGLRDQPPRGQPPKLAPELAEDFKERVRRIRIKKNSVGGVETEQSEYSAPIVVDTAGPFSTELGRTVGIDLPVIPDSHEGAVTEPVRPFFKCMVVDIRPGPGSKNFYFYQNLHGQVIFCITPDPPIVGTAKGETSVFLPQVCARIVRLLPRLKNLRVRRTWRGLYPMTPDGSPIAGWNRQVNGLLHATGMCGQGLMLGPGTGELVARMIADQTTADDHLVLEEFSPYRKFERPEVLK